MALHIARAGVPVGVFSLEMSRDELICRCAMTAADESEDTNSALTKVHGLPIYITDNPDISAAGIRAFSKMMLLRHQIRVVIVDYIQLVAESGNKSSNREREVATISRAFKLAAKENGQMFMALSQVNEDGKIRESRAVEHDADAVLHVINSETDHWVRVCKNRHGAKHGPISVMKENDPGIPLKFQASQFKFSES